MSCHRYHTCAHTQALRSMMRIRWTPAGAHTTCTVQGHWHMPPVATMQLDSDLLQLPTRPVHRSRSCKCSTMQRLTHNSLPTMLCPPAAPAKAPDRPGWAWSLVRGLPAVPMLGGPHAGPAPAQPGCSTHPALHPGCWSEVQGQHNSSRGQTSCCMQYVCFVPCMHACMHYQVVHAMYFSANGAYK